MTNWLPLSDFEKLYICDSLSKVSKEDSGSLRYVFLHYLRRKWFNWLSWNYSCLWEKWWCTTIVQIFICRWRISGKICPKNISDIQANLPPEFLEKAPRSYKFSVLLILCFKFKDCELQGKAYKLYLRLSSFFLRIYTNSLRVIITIRHTPFCTLRLVARPLLILLGCTFLFCNSADLLSYSNYNKNH